MDEKILKQLFLANIFPPYISAESHSIDVFSTLVTLGNYRSFNLVDGPSVSKNYGEAKIRSKFNSASMTRYAFAPDSGGPFGEDISSPWMTPDNFFQHLALEGLGWKDIHASREIIADPSNKICFFDYVKKYLLKKIFS